MLEGDAQTAADITQLAPLEDNCKLLAQMLDDCVRLESGTAAVLLRCCSSGASVAQAFPGFSSSLLF